MNFKCFKDFLICIKKTVKMYLTYWIRSDYMDLVNIIYFCMMFGVYVVLNNYI